MRQAGLWNARREARACVTRLGISAPEHIRVDAIAKRLAALRGFRLRIIEGPLDGADSQLVRFPGELTIIISDRIKDTASRKFVIAHELGHVVLEHPMLPPHRIGDAAASPPTADDVRDYEAEANAFASELTMPHLLIRDWCRVVPVNLEMPWRIARTFGMSILAASRRFAELSPERCAAVFAAHRKVMWCTESASFTVPIERYRYLDPGSLASAFWSKGAIEEREQFVPANAWLRTTASVQIVEHATASHEFRTVLSMLWVPDHAAEPLGMAA
ncbi:MAG TPA: ImmA/IrrE family metallo-endopeptidase [Kofleriaceae bacterium]|jgi:Zn-dependent peptidase ImmA (M78 family)